MKTGNVARMQVLSRLEIAPAELCERRKRVICAANCSSEGFSACGVCFVSSDSSQGTDIQGLDVPQAGQIENTAMASVAHRQVRNRQ